MSKWNFIHEKRVRYLVLGVERVVTSAQVEEREREGVGDGGVWRTWYGSAELDRFGWRIVTSRPVMALILSDTRSATLRSLSNNHALHNQTRQVSILYRSIY